MEDFSFKISSMVNLEIFGLVYDGLKITKEKHPQQIELNFFTTKENIRWDYKFILSEGLPLSWAKLVRTIMRNLIIDS